MPDPGKGFGQRFGNESAQTPADTDVTVRTASSLRNPRSWDKKPAMTVEAVPLRAQQPEPSPPSDQSATPSSPEPTLTAAYVACELGRVGEPTAMSSAALGEIILEVVGVEGPVVAERVYQLINHAAGNRRLGHVIRSAMLAACERLQRSGRIVADDPLGDGALLATLRLPDQPLVSRRDIGPRSLQHVPPSEIGAMIQSERERSNLSGTALYRQVHRMFGHDRMREAAVPRYEACDALVERGQGVSDDRFP